MKKHILLHSFLRLTTCAACLFATHVGAAEGDLLEADFGSGTILRFAANGTQTTFATGLTMPVGMAFDRAGNLFVADTGTGSILEFTPAGAQITFSSEVMAGPTGLAFDAAGNLFAGEFNSGTVYKLAPDGSKSIFVSGLTNPTGLAFDRTGNLFVADLGGGTVFKVTTTGVTSSFAAGLVNPAGLAFDAAGNLFVSDLGGGAIYKFAPDGTQSTFASGLSGPAGLAFDGSGNLFAGDNTSSVILKFTPDGTMSTFASGLNTPTFIAFEPITEKFRNVSARGFVQTGDNVLIGGFILGGSALPNNAVVVRAIGPSLAAAGVTEPLQDPLLELHDGSGALIATNDNWQDTQEAQITASGLAPTDPHESVILTALPSGNYTAIVRGVGDTTGVALLEIYNPQ